MTTGGIDLRGHAALVTGSTRGVGRAIVEAFARAGADVIVHGMEASEAEEAARVCRAAGVKADYVVADLLSAPAVDIADSLLREAVARMPNLDILANNAGHYLDVAFEEMTLERFERTMSLNVEVPYFLTQRFARHWVEQRTNGRVLMTGSINGRLAEQESTAYDTSKGAVEMMVKTLAVALAPKDIRVNGVAPGLVRTHQTRWLDAKPDVARWIAYHTPDGQIPAADACAGAAVFLVSDAASHIHGQMLLVDGGMSAWQHPGPPSA